MIRPKLIDSLEWAKTLTIKRVWNLILCYVGFYVSKLTKKPYQLSMPVSIAIEPTTSCNLRCPECPSGLRSFSRETGMLQQSFFEKMVSELAPATNYLTFYFQGEPYLNPSFLEMVKFANSKKIYTATSTNAHYLNDEMAKKTIESGLKRLIISIDGTSQETYSSYRVGGNLSKVIEGAKDILKWKKQLNSNTPYVIFQFLVVKPNEHQIEGVLKLAKEVGVDDVRFKTAQVYDYKNGNALIPENENYSRYKKNTDGTYSIKNNLENQCWRMWQSAVITWDGKVVPCCFDKDAQHQLGNVSTHTFKEVWQGKAYKNFRESILKSRNEIEICKNCSEGTKVWG